VTLEAMGSDDVVKGNPWLAGFYAISNIIVAGAMA
jgi:hypothetical protein